MPLYVQRSTRRAAGYTSPLEYQAAELAKAFLQAARKAVPFKIRAILADGKAFSERFRPQMPSHRVHDATNQWEGRALKQAAKPSAVFSSRPQR